MLLGDRFGVNHKNTGSTRGQNRSSQPKTGSTRAQNTVKKVSDLFVVLGLLIIFHCIFGVLKYSKNGELMIPDGFQYFLDDFWNFQKVHQIWTRAPCIYLWLLLYQNTSENSKKYVGTSSQNIILADMDFKKL